MANCKLDSIKSELPVMIVANTMQSLLSIADADTVDAKLITNSTNSTVPKVQ